MMNGYANRFREIEEVRKNWGWFLVLGVLLIALGAAVISSSFYATVFSVVLLGFFLLAAGAVQIVQGFLARKWKGFFLSLLLGLLYIVTGVYCIWQPILTGITLTLWIAVFFIIVGIFRMISTLFLRYENWGWVFFNGLITLILGILIYNSWPISGLWVIGMFVGVDMILSGWSWILLSLSARHRG